MDLQIRILIVDDEPEITAVLERHLTLEGYDVEACNNPVEALAKIKTDNYMVVISDIMMPQMSGIQLLQEIKAYHGGIQVIMLTGYVTMSNVLSCMRSGASSCTFKPLHDMNEITREVDKAVEDIRAWQDRLVRLQGLERTDAIAS